jgi:putative peptide zinc metalloprotease protein
VVVEAVVVTAPCLRADLSFHEQRYGAESSYVVKDIAAQRYFRFGLTEVHVMRAFDGRHTPQEIAALLVEQGMRISARAVEQFARKLASAGLLERTMAERTTLEMERLRADRRTRRKLFRGEALRMRWSFGDPDALLSRTLPYVRWMFTPAFLAASLVLFAIYLIVLGQRWPEYVGALQSSYSPTALTVGHVIVFIATALVVVLIHELGHAYTCKYFGGEVRELGFMLLYFQPAFYCNVSDAWSFPERRARLWVTAAGSWIQLVVAAVAAIVWYAAAPGTLVAEVSAAAMLVGGVMTLLTNMNPLLPLDGYFALTDWLDIPNLRQRAFAHVAWWIKRNLLRVEAPEPVAAPRERRVFFIYGTLAVAYVSLTFAVFAVLVSRWVGQAFGALGVFVVALAGVFAMRNNVAAWLRTTLFAIRSRSARRRLGSMRLGLLVLLVVVVGLVIPKAQTTAGAFVVRPASPDSVDVRIALANAGATRVRAGQVVHLISYADVSTPRTGRVSDASGGVEASVRMTRGEAWRPGVRGEARIELERSTLAGVVLSSLRQALRIDLWL